MFWQRDLCLAARGAPLRTILPPALSAVLRERWTALIQYLINRQRKDEGYRIAEERIQPDEEQYLQTMIDSNWEYMTQHWTPGNYQRGGNTKTHGVGSGEVTIRDDLPPQFRHDILADSRTYRAWVRFSGPGPDWPKDIDDIGFVSCSIKLMEVPGPKLLENEKFTQDLLSVCTHFAGSDDAVVVEPDADKPTRRRYWSCVPYLLGQGQAMMYSIYPGSKVYQRIPRLPLRPSNNYLRDNMVRTLAEQDDRMPIENNAVRWPEKLSPFVPTARMHIPKQKFDFRSNSPSPTISHTTPGTVCPSIVRSAIRAVPGSRCTLSCRDCGSG